MPVHLSKSGKAAVGPSGKVEKKFKSKKKALAYVRARGLAHARSKGYKVPSRRKKR